MSAMPTETIVLSSTVDETTEFCWKWTIPNFDMMKHYRKRFKLNHGKIDMDIEMKPFTGNLYSRNEPVWKFRKVHKSLNGHLFKMDITSENDRKFYSRTGFKEIFVGDQYFGTERHPIQKSNLPYLLDSSKAANFIINLIIVGKNSIVSSKYSHLMTHDKIIDINGVSQLLGSKEFSDFEFTIGDDKIPAHKFMLAARSKICEDIFCGNDKAKEKGLAVIKGISKEIFMNFLAYLYHDKPIDFSKDKEEYLMLFEKFGMTNLLHVTCA